MLKRVSLWVSVLLSLFLVMGCASKPRGSAEVSDQSTGGAYGADGASGGASASAASQGGAWTGDPLQNPDSLLATRVIYFDYDQSGVGQDYRSVISAHAEYLVSHPQVTVRLEGHADERGTREYNLALGEKRADAVRSLMMAEGVSDTQLVVVSYGEERPSSMEHNEEAWGLNRRVELVY